MPLSELERRHFISFVFCSEDYKNFNKGISKNKMFFKGKKHGKKKYEQFRLLYYLVSSVLFMY